MNKDGYNHQDWNDVVIRSKSSIKKDKKPENPQGTKDRIALESNDDIFTLNKITKEKSNNIVKLRNEKNLTQNDIAKALNISVSLINDYESGKVTNYNERTYNTICKKIKMMPIKL